MMEPTAYMTTLTCKTMDKLGWKVDWLNPSVMSAIPKVHPDVDLWAFIISRFAKSSLLISQ